MSCSWLEGHQCSHAGSPNIMGRSTQAALCPERSSVKFSLPLRGASSCNTNNHHQPPVTLSGSLLPDYAETPLYPLLAPHGRPPRNHPLLCGSAPRSGHRGVPTRLSWLVARAGHPTVPPLTLSARSGHLGVPPRSRAAPDQAIQGPPRSRSTNTLSAGSRRSCQGGLVTM